MTRTLVVSDLHLGARLGRDVLRRPVALEALLDALEGVDRLVLLGDVVELLEGRPAQAMDAAAPVLRALGERLGGEREAILVPGNHDAALVAALAARARRPGRGSTPRSRSTRRRRWPQVASLLWPARVRVHYPGVYLASGCGRRTATTSTATCSRRPRSASPAACSGACRATAPTPADYEGRTRRSRASRRC